MSVFQESSKIADKVYASWGHPTMTEAERIALLPILTPVELDCLKQLATPVWDGNLISKSGRSSLCNKGLVSTWNGLNFATQDGYCVLDTLKMLGDTSKFGGWSPKKV